MTSAWLISCVGLVRSKFLQLNNAICWDLEVGFFFCSRGSNGGDEHSWVLLFFLSSRQISCLFCCFGHEVSRRNHLEKDVSQNQEHEPSPTHSSLKQPSHFLELHRSPLPCNLGQNCNLFKEWHRGGMFTDPFVLKRTFGIKCKYFYQPNFKYWIISSVWSPHVGWLRLLLDSPLLKMPYLISWYCKCQFESGPKTSYHGWEELNGLI